MIGVSHRLIDRSRQLLMSVRRVIAAVGLDLVGIAAFDPRQT